MKSTDLDMLASDLADLFDRYDNPIDASEDHIRAALPAFLAQISEAAAADDDTVDDDWEHAGDAATWTPSQDVPVDPIPQTGPAPAMTRYPWHLSQGVDLGDTGPRERYWRCPVCRVWAGPYTDVMICKRDGMDHRNKIHDHPKAVRSEARKAARRVRGPGMTAAVFDALVDRVSDTHGLPTMTVHHIIERIASVHAGYAGADDLTRGNPPTREVVLELAGELGCRDWLIRMGA